MRDISAALRRAYNAESGAVIPGGGTYAMEAVARQLATDAKVVVLRNGWFSYRWTQILEAGKIPAESFVLKARPMEPESGERGRQAPLQPLPVEEDVARIAAENTQSAG